VLLQKRFHAQHDFGRRHFEGLGDSEYLPNRGAADPAFNQADVGPIKTGLQSQALLGDFLAAPHLAQGHAERFLRANVRVDLFAWWFANPLRQYFNADILRKILPRKIFRILGLAA
jgi:hypothetical protein